MTKASSPFHTCNHTQDNIDCTACKLAQLCNDTREKRGKVGKGDGDKPLSIDEDGDYSISTELTQKGNDFSILYLVIAAFALFALVIFFTKLLSM